MVGYKERDRYVVQGGAMMPWQRLLLPASLEAARQVVMDPEFEATLQNVRDRVDEIESLHRTRELTVCSFLPLSSDREGY